MGAPRGTRSKRTVLSMVVLVSCSFVCVHIYACAVVNYNGCAMLKRLHPAVVSLMRVSCVFDPCGLRVCLSFISTTIRAFPLFCTLSLLYCLPYHDSGCCVVHALAALYKCASGVHPGYMLLILLRLLW